MIPIHQTIIDPDSGDCFPACLASILELPLEAIPHFLKLYGRELMREKANEWLESAFRLRLMAVKLDQKENSGRPILPYKFLFPGMTGALCLIGGKSMIFPDRDHVVIGRIINDLYEWELIHDPNPAGSGLKDGKAIFFYFFINTDPRQIVVSGIIREKYYKDGTVENIRMHPNALCYECDHYLRDHSLVGYRCRTCIAEHGRTRCRMADPQGQLKLDPMMNGEYPDSSGDAANLSIAIDTSQNAIKGEKQ